MPYPPQPPYGPGSVPPGAPFPPYPPYPPYPYGPPIAPPGTASGAGVPMYPRSFGDVLGAIFTAYGKNFWALTRLALVAVLLPEVVIGLAQSAIYLVVGANPLGPVIDTSAALLNQLGVNSPTIGPTLSASQAQLFSELSLVVTVVALLIGAWQIALMAHGAREATLGRPVRVGAAIGAGLRRILPTLGVTLLVNLITLLALAPGLIALTLALVTNSPLAAFLGFMLVAAGFVVALFLSVRLTLAPYIAALGLGRAINRSWELTRGHWWRVFGAVFLIGLMVGVVESVFSNVELASFLVSVAIVTPLIITIATPLLSLTYTTLLYDLRVRRDGYPTVIREG